MTKLTPEQLQEQAAIAARLAALGLPILTAEKSREYRDAIDARRLAAIGRMSAGAFMATFSAAGRVEPVPVRYDAARGCTHPNTVVERWNGQKWIEVELTWTGSKYEEIN